MTSDPLSSSAPPTGTVADPAPGPGAGRAALAAMAGAALVLALVLALVIGPRPARAGEPTGDPALSARLEQALGGRTGYGAVSVVLIEDGRATRAGLGAGPDTPFEIGSVTKALTGMLLADAVERGEVTPQTRLEEIVPGAGRTSLQDLATHRSGLPRLPRDPAFLARSVLSGLTGGNPYAGTTPAGVEGYLRDEQPAGGAGFAYSNLGAAALGQALATEAGTPYPDLLRERILAPLGMTATIVAEDGDALPAGHARPVAASGRERSPWTGTGTAPAGTGTWSTAADMEKLLTAVAAGTAPGADAVTPRADAGEGQRIGLFWITSEIAGHPTVWHNGATGGMRSFVGYQPETGRGIVLLGATDRDLDDVAADLLEES